jgi:hypothetical protein
LGENNCVTEPGAFIGSLSSVPLDCVPLRYEIFSNKEMEYGQRLPHKVGKLISVPGDWHHRPRSLSLEITPYMFKILKLKRGKRGQ